MSSNMFLSKRIAQEFTKNLIGNFAKPSTVEAYRKMIYYRCNNLGMKELDISLGKWASENVERLSMQDCEQFESEVLDLETPDLFNLILKAKVEDDLKEFVAKKYIKTLREYAMNGLQ